EGRPSLARGLRSRIEGGSRIILRLGTRSPAGNGWAFSFLRCTETSTFLPTASFPFGGRCKCQKQSLLNARGETKNKANRRALKPESLFARRCITFAKAGTARRTQNKRSPSVYRKHAEPGLSWLLQNHAQQRVVPPHTTNHH